MTKKQMRKRVKELYDEAVNRFIGHNPIFDEYDYMYDKEQKEYARLQYKLGISEYNPDE